MGNFIFFLLTLFALAALLRIDFFFTILYLFVGVYILSHIWSRQVQKQLYISRTLPQRAFIGDRITVTLKLENRSRLPIPWLMLSEVFPVELASPPFFRKVVTMGGKSNHIAQYTLTARKRGYYKIGPFTLHIGDLLNIRGEQISQIKADYLIVYPKIIPIAQLTLPTHSPQTILPTALPLFQDPTRLIGVKDYTPGDNPRYIHWPITAATGKTLVKQFQPAISRDNAIFLNLNRPDYAERAYPDPAIELAITVAASLANHILALEKLPVALTTTALDPLTDSQQRFNLPSRKGRSQLMQILELLARVQAITDKPHFLEDIRRQAVHLAWGTTIIIITSHETEALSKLLLLLKRSGFQLSLVLIQPLTTMAHNEAEPVRALAIPTFKIGRDKDVTIWSTQV